MPTKNPIESTVVPTQVQDAPELTPVAKPAKEAEGSEIARAIAEGLKTVVGQKNFVIAADKSVDPRFTVVKNKQGEVFVRENATNRLSKVQLQSLEEKESSIQGQEVTEV